MFLFILSLHLHDIGYGTVEIPKNEMLDIQEENFSFVFSSDSQLSFKIYSKKFNQSHKLSPQQYVQIKSHHIRFLSKKENAKLQMWKIPNNLCNLRSMILLTDYETKFSMPAKQVSNDFCLFSQFDFVAYYTHLKFHSSSKNCTLNYYISSEFDNRKPSFVCKSDEDCNFNFFSPFFISFEKCQNSLLSISFSGQIARRNVKKHACSLGTLKSYSSSGGYDFKSPIGAIENFECKEASKQFKIIASVSFLVVVVLSLIFFCLVRKFHSEKLSAGIPAV